MCFLWSRGMRIAAQKPKRSSIITGSSHRTLYIPDWPNFLEAPKPFCPMELPSNSFFSNNSLSVPYSMLPSSLCEYTAASASFPSEYFFPHSTYHNVWRWYKYPCSSFSCKNQYPSLCQQKFSSLKSTLLDSRVY